MRDVWDRIKLRSAVENAEPIFGGTKEIAAYDIPEKHYTFINNILYKGIMQQG